MVRDVFKLENGLLILDKEYIRGIEEFRRILERDRGSEGDADGRKKFMAFKHFMYMYITNSPAAYPQKGGYSDKESHIAGIKESKLPDNYKPDAELKTCMEKYKEIRAALNPASQSLSIIVKSLRLSSKIAENITTSMEDSLEAMAKEKAQLKASGEPTNIPAELLMNEKLIAQLDQVIKISNKVPDTIKTLEATEARLLQEEMGESLGRGGRKIGNRAEPKRQ